MRLYKDLCKRRQIAKMENAESKYVSQVSQQSTKGSSVQKQINTELEDIW